MLMKFDPEGQELPGALSGKNLQEVFMRGIQPIP